MATLWLPVTLTLLVVKMNVHHEHDSYSVNNLQSEHISLYNDRKALTYEVSYLGKAQICAWAAFL